MQPAAYLSRNSETRLETATVNAAPGGAHEGAYGEAYLVAGPSGAFRALRATGCLLVPARGDKVLLALCPQEAYILCVLARAASGAGTPEAEERPCLELPPDAMLSASGRLRLRADELELEGRERLALTGRVVRLAGELLTQTFSRLETAVTYLGLTAGRCIAFFGRRTTRVEDLDEIRAGRMRLASRTALRVRAENASLRAEKNLDLDGDHINLG